MANESNYDEKVQEFLNSIDFKDPGCPITRDQLEKHENIVRQLMYGERSDTLFIKLPQISTSVEVSLKAFHPDQETGLRKLKSYAKEEAKTLDSLVGINPETGKEELKKKVYYYANGKRCELTSVNAVKNLLEKDKRGNYTHANVGYPITYKEYDKESQKWNETRNVVSYHAPSETFIGRSVNDIERSLTNNPNLKAYGVEITSEEDKKKLAEGRAIFLEGCSVNDKVFNTHVQYDAAKNRLVRCCPPVQKQAEEMGFELVKKQPQKVEAKVEEAPKETKGKAQSAGKAKAAEQKAEALKETKKTKMKVG